MEYGEFYKNHYNGIREKYDSTGQLILKSKYIEGRMVDTSFIYFGNGCLEAMEIMDNNGRRTRRGPKEPGRSPRAAR
jgi:antitoxin component YwqK of YwqJK toxin-antitoxin module